MAPVKIRIDPSSVSQERLSTCLNDELIEDFVRCDFDLKGISLSNQMKLALDLARYNEEYNA